MINIQRNSDGSLKTNRSAHTADLICTDCGAAVAGVDMNALAFYRPGAICLQCTTMGGSCDTATCWPLTNGTADAQEIALVKTA